MKLEWTSEGHKERTTTYTREMFKLYIECVQIVERTVKQNLTIEFDKINVQGGSVVNSVQEQIHTIADAEAYMEKVHDILRKLPGLYQTIITERFIRGRKHHRIWIELGVPESTYYRMYDESLLLISCEEAALYVEKRLKSNR